ncbi:hypothetical protein ACFL42_04245 [Candidatus Omnitrophota bacterium]
MGLKKVIAVLAVFLISAFILQSAFAQVITNRTGTITITKPDGTVLIVGASDPLPNIPSGSVIEVLYGTIQVAPDAGTFTIVAGNTTATVSGGQEAQVGLDVATGAAEVTSIVGTIQTETAGVQASVSTGSTAVISADATTGNVSVTATSGTVTVTGTDGSVSVISQGETSTTGAAAGAEIVTTTTTTDEGEDESPEPEVPEPEQPDASE